MKDPNFIAQEAGLNFNSVVEAIIKHSCIIDYGIIQNIVADGVVDVSVAVSRTEQDMLCMTCVLANIASAGFTLNVKPAVGDRVLVVYPRIYDDKMFTVPNGEEDKKKIIVNFDAKGYNLMSGIAILMNQYKKASHKNVITLEEGRVTLGFGYDKDKGKNLITVETSKKGDLNVLLGDKDETTYLESSFKADGSYTVNNGKSTVAVGKDGYLKYENTDDNSTKVQFTSSGMTVQDKNGCKIVSDSGSIVINNKLKIKK